MKVLEIGTGCGYQAAVLSKLCRRVYSIERYRELLRDAEERFRTLRIGNVTTRWGDGMKGWPEQAPFDRIILTAAATEVPPELFQQLGADGILIAPIGRTSHDQVLVRYRRKGDEWETENLWPVRFVPLLDGTVNDVKTRSKTTIELNRQDS